MRLGLPLGAVVLMSTIFLASRSVDPSRAIALSNLDLAEITRTPRIGGARFAAVGETGTALEITATALRTSTELRGARTLDLVLDAPRGHLAFPERGTARFQAEHGHIDQAADAILLRGDVTLETSTGYRVTLDALRSDLGGTVITGDGPVTGQGPAGQIRANALSLRADAAREGAYVLAFTGDVRLLYSPERQGAAP